MNDMNFLEEAGRHERALDVAKSAADLQSNNENGLSLATEEELLAISHNKYGSGRIRNRWSTAAVRPAADSNCTAPAANSAGRAENVEGDCEQRGSPECSSRGG
eukprot:9257735-Karenia_brevis.AAC.1